MAVVKDLTGKVFFRLTVISEFGRNKSGNAVWLCKCACGRETKKVGSALLNGDSKSCGCYAVEQTKKRNTTHGFTKVGEHQPEYNAWRKMKDRCYKVTDNRYYRYGARGITVCQRWLESFENFILDMGRRPSSLHSLDRYPNNDGNYEPGNCRWATDEQQRRNKSNNVMIEFDGRKQILTDWCRELKFNIGSFYKRNKIKYPTGADYLKYIKER